MDGRTRRVAKGPKSGATMITTPRSEITALCHESLPQTWHFWRAEHPIEVRQQVYVLGERESRISSFPFPIPIRKRHVISANEASIRSSLFGEFEDL